MSKHTPERLKELNADLLEALEDAVGDLEVVLARSEHFIDLTVYRAAIAKAKGESQ